MFITYTKKNGNLYARIDVAKRKGKSVVKETTNLGRVLDKEKGIYKNRERGIFTYDLTTNTYGSVGNDFIDPTTTPKKEELVLDFGDTYLLFEFINNFPQLKDALSSIGINQMDTFWTLLYYYILSSHANSHCDIWVRGNLARILFPHADLSSQRISDLLQTLGEEWVYRKFFKSYLKLFKDDFGGDGSNILIDSTGLPNDVHFPLTAVSNHNGEIENEVRLIYVTQQETGLPVYFRYCAGNVIDVSTLSRTIEELKHNGINTKFSILDAGYLTLQNMGYLYENHVSFLTRVKPNLKLYKDVIAEHFENLRCKENFITYNERTLYLKRIPIEVEVSKDHTYKGYAYLGLDESQQGLERKGIVKRAKNKGLGDGEIYDQVQSRGVFMLFSTREIALDKVLPLYYTRDQIEKVFSIGKGEANLLPIRTHTEATFRGHLLLTFMATVVIKLMKDTLKGCGMTFETAMMEMRNQKCLVYDDAVITREPQAMMNQIYKTCKIKCPVSIPRT